MQKMREAAEAKMKMEQQQRTEREISNLESQLLQLNQKKQMLSSQLNEQLHRHDTEVQYINNLDEKIEVH